MRVCVVVLMAALVGCSEAAVGQVDDPAVAKQKYEADKARVIAGDLSVDWQAFRVAARVANVGGNFSATAAEARASADLGAGRNEEALAEGKSIIDHNMADPFGHLIATTALEKMGRNGDADRERAILVAIVKSIMDSGDGKSAKTAWFTVDPLEEHFVMQVVLRVLEGQQQQVKKDGHSYDRVVVVDEKGSQHDVWFNIDTDLQAMLAAYPKEK